MPRGTRAQQREQTRNDLISAARHLFAERGYAAVSLAEIVSAAGVTKGALYHHFDSKRAIFDAALTEVQHAVATEVVTAAAAHTDPWDQFIAGCRAFLQASTAPDIQQVMLIDGPAVLGWRQWRALDEQTSGFHLGESLDDLIKAGLIAKQPVAPLTHLLSGAMNEAALWLATSESAQFDEAWAALNRILLALRT